MLIYIIFRGEFKERGVIWACSKYLLSVFLKRGDTKGKAKRPLTQGFRRVGKHPEHNPFQTWRPSSSFLTLQNGSSCTDSLGPFCYGLHCPSHNAELEVLFMCD